MGRQPYDSEYRRAQWRNSNEPETARVYRLKYLRSHLQYKGVVDCPMCGKHGYLYERRGYNLRTGVVYGFITREVRHFHKEQGHNVYDGYCYLDSYRVAG